MALGNAPSRDDIWNELQESTYRNGGTNLNHLKDMDAYVFGGDGSGYSRDGFGGYGVPRVSNLSASDAENAIQVTFDLDDDGGLGCTIIAQYWEATGDTSPSPYYEEGVGTVSGTGTKTMSFTPISNEVLYEIRIVAYNLFNNVQNFPAPRVENYYYDFTNTAQATSQNPQHEVPTILGDTAVMDFNNVCYVDLSAGGEQSNIVVQFEVTGANNNTGQNATHDCTSGIATTTPELITDLGVVSLDASQDTVQIRAKATGSKEDSDWTAWYTVTWQSHPSCPL